MSQCANEDSPLNYIIQTGVNKCVVIKIMIKFQKLYFELIKKND